MAKVTPPEDQYPELWHYTTKAGLRGILESQTLWATDFRVLNDTSEVRHLKDRLITLAHPGIQALFDRKCKCDPSFRKKVEDNGGSVVLAQHDARLLVEALYNVTFPSDSHGPYVTSFCSHEEADDWTKSHGLLSQWRAYGSGGYAIVFDTMGLKECLDQESENFHYWNLHFSDVVYDDEDERFKLEFRNLLDSMPEAFEEILTSTEDFESIKTNELFKPFVMSTSRFKHRAFKEENEVRIVAFPLYESDIPSSEEKSKKIFKTVHTRQGNVTYIELFDYRRIRLPIRRIVVGPHSEQKDLEQLGRKLVQGQDIPVHCSETPYISR